MIFGRLAGVLERNANHPSISVDHDANSNVRFGEHVDYIPKKEKIDPLAITQTPVTCSASITMSSTSNPPSLRRVKKFASSSVLDSNYTSAGAPPTLNPTQNNFRTLVNITNHPPNHPRSRSQSQSQFEGPRFPFHNHQTQRFAQKSVSQAALHVKQHVTIESLISSPPASLVEALQDLRYLILTEGVTADMDGNVRGRSCLFFIRMRRLIYYCYPSPLFGYTSGQSFLESLQ